MKLKKQIISETSNVLDNLCHEYNHIKTKKFDKVWDTFKRIHNTITKLYNKGEVYIYAGDCEFEHLLEILENDGPEYSAIIIFSTDGNHFYEIGVCVRGRPLYKKIKSKKVKKTIQIIQGRVGSSFK